MMAGALLYNVKDAARLQKIRFALFKLGISGRTVAPEELSHPVGYLCGLTGKLLTGDASYVVFFYIADILMVATDLVLTLRNRRLDRERDNA